MSIKSELAKVKAPNTPRQGTQTHYVTHASKVAPKRATVIADRGYVTQLSRGEVLPKGASQEQILHLPKGATADHVLSGADELIRLLSGQSLVVQQNVFTRVAALKSSPKVNTVRTMIMQEIQRVEREG